tara:strand:+ start:534 stop:992 length:459 start_codon:yes stop_codon:yes gene_type:complete
LNEIKNKNYWQLTKKVLPQHTDHAGVLWHGWYLNFLEEARIEALSNVGISYSQLSTEGFEIPVVAVEINYKLSFFHGDLVCMKSHFYLVNKIKLHCKTLFLKSNGEIGAEALIQIVVVIKKNDRMQIVRNLPERIQNIFLLLEEGPKNINNS